MPPGPNRFHDLRWTKYDFLDLILVRCPRCDGVARVMPVSPEGEGARTSLSAERRVVCRHCAHARESTGNRPSLHRGTGQAVDPYFGLPLRLRSETRRGRLWACTLEHLRVIGRFVRAALREHAPWHLAVRRMTVTGRPPAWAGPARNRAEVLQAVDRVRKSLADRSRREPRQPHDGRTPRR